jgi:transposase-like protein
MVAAADKKINLNSLPQDESAAREMLESMRWPDGNVACPHCGGAEPYKLTPKAGSSTRQGVWKCKACRKQFTVTVGTIFESSHIKLTVWLKAIYLLCSSKKGMSAHQLHRMLGITYKAAWFMAHRLRYAMTQEPFASKLSGIIEADDTFIGARKKRGTKGGKPGPDSHKSVVMALVERGGRVRAFPIERVTSENLSAAIREHVDIQNSTLMTDSAAQYTLIGREFERHEVVNHTKDEYVRGDAYTNTAEGFFSLLKRGITGSYHHVGKGHLHRYCDEFSFRYDRRKMTDLERSKDMVLGAEGKRLTYKQPAGTRPQ